MIPDRPVPVWKEQAREQLHRAIMDAARATFAERGYHAATIEEIATRAAVGKGTVYNYVEGGKDGLFLSVLADHFDALQALAEQLLADPAVPLRTRFTAFATAFAAYFEQHRDLLFVHLREVPQLLLSAGGGEAAARLRAQRNRLVETMVPALEGAMARGE
ncbi:MAG TPA: helix-turn-helix domain-containing protein, partial [Rhodothermales bacterium]|nr:helix-turn-helix domain-containing protein [Rhodothermales bacterium]